MDDQVTVQRKNIHLSMTPLQAAIYERRGKQGDAKELFELTDHERHREMNVAEYFSGPAYLRINEEVKAEEKFKRLVKMCKNDLT